ncbi:MAG: Fic family protein [Opitutaceae bacterium]|nr:Fic family protein [Opitutaceae bacterium]
MAVFFGTSDPKQSNKISRAVTANKARKIAPKVYTDDLTTPIEDIVRRHRLEIVAHFYPGAVISHRSAIETNVSPRGKLHLTLPGAAQPKRILPGLEIRIWNGPAAQPDDIQTSFGTGMGLYTASQPRALLENMQIARARADDETKTLSQEELDRWIDRQIRVFGPAWLDQTLSQAETVAQRLGWNREYGELTALVTAFKSASSPIHLVTDVAQARARGTPFDPERMTLFGLLHARLAVESFRALPRMPAEEVDNRAFWEAYFSNYIEGTKFTVEEAHAIVYNPTAAKDINRKRPHDAHDIAETHRLIIDPNISVELPKSADSFIELIKRRHARMMSSRLDVAPGVFKALPNSVGSHTFVLPAMVEETLRRGLPAVYNLPTATARAFYMLFLVSEVHPFNDGNGRISRLCMNAELEAAGQARLIIPTSFRTDYLGVLGALSLRSDPDPFVAFAHKMIGINGQIPFGSFEKSHEHFKKTGAMNEAPGTFDISPFAL